MRSLIGSETMESEIDTAGSLEREKAIGFAARAAVRWADRCHALSLDVRGRSVLRMLAASWASRARAHQGMPSLSVGRFVRAFEEPLSEWLPGAPRQVLLDEGEPTPLCFDMAEDAGSSPAAEVE